MSLLGKNNTYQDASLKAEERARLLLDELALEEKMAQINSVFPFDQKAKDFEWIRSQVPYGIGEVSTLEMRQIKTLEEAAQWVKEVQKIVMENSPHHIPAVFHMEGLCGAFIQEATSFPSGIARGASFDPELEQEIAACVATQEVACGVTHILAPVLDISRDSRMGRQGETYGEDPALASAMGVAYTKGAQGVEVNGRHAESVAKHFLAFHNSQGGIHGTHSDTPERLLQEIYGKPFQAAIQEAKLKGIMPCYCSIDGEPASVSHKLLTELLREQMGFDGVCVSDYGGIANSHNCQRIGETMAETGAMALEAGMDVEMPDPNGYGKELMEMFRQKKADMALLDQAVYRVLCAKFRMGLFEQPYPLLGDELLAVYKKADDGKRTTRKSAMESVVLLKNDGVLPLDKANKKKLALIGPHAVNARMFFGGYTHMTMMESIYAVANSIAGVSGIENLTGEEIQVVPGTNIQLDQGEKYDAILRTQKPECRSLEEYLKEYLPDWEIKYAKGYQIAGEDETLFEEALQLIRESDMAILTLGGKYGTCSLASMGEGVDGADINLPKCQDDFIRRAAEENTPLIGVHIFGRPISSDVADEYLNAIVEAWNGAECAAEAITKTLFGENNPAGRLPVSVAYNSGQIPVYYNHPNGSAEHQSGSIGFANYVDLPHRPRYCFGYGLSYSAFRYQDLEIPETEVEPFGEISLSFTVENTSERAGDEVVQIYLSDCFASRTRPVKELAAFRRISLKAHEKKTIRCQIAASQLAFLDKNMKWKIEKGDVDILIGASSEDIRLRSNVHICEDAWIEGRNRAFYGKAEVL